MKKKRLGLIGMAAGLIGMFCSIGGPNIAMHLHPMPPVDSEAVAEFIADVTVKTGGKLKAEAANAAKNLFSRKKKGSTDAAGEAGEGIETAGPPVAEPPAIKADSPRQAAKKAHDRLLFIFTIAGLGCGLAAMSMGLIGWIKNEDHRPAVSACIMGFAALAWVYIAIGIVVGIACIVIAKLT